MENGGDSPRAGPSGQDATTEEPLADDPVITKATEGETIDRSKADASPNTQHQRDKTATVKKLVKTAAAGKKYSIT